MSNLKKGKEVRDRERAKNKGGRGGGKKFSIENEDEMVLRERVVTGQKESRTRRRGEDDDDSNDSDSGSEDEGVQKAQENVFGFAQVPKVGHASAAAEESGDEVGSPITPTGPSRKEREASEALRAKEEYMRKHLAGETEQARKDMERLALVRKRREEQARQREAEGRAPGWSADGIDSDADDEDVLSRPQKPAAAPAAAPAPVLSEAAAKKKAAAAAVVDEPEVAADGGPPKLKGMDIKAMNGDALKDALKARGLPTQGAKKDLMKRLTDYEAARP